MEKLESQKGLSTDEVLTRQAQESIKIIEKLLTTMHDDIKQLMNLENLEKGCAKIEEKSRRINNVAVALQKTLDRENGGKIAENLEHIYKHVRFAALRAYENHDFSYLQSAEKVTKEINEGWTKMSEAAAA